MRKVLFTALVIAWCFSPLLGAQNLIPNPGFEEPSTRPGAVAGGWWLYQGNGEAELQIDRTVAHSGRGSAQVRAASPGKCTLVSPTFAIAPGDEIRFQAWVRTAGAAGEHVPTTVGLAFRDAGGRVFQRRYVQVPLANAAWFQAAGEATAPAGAASAELHLGCTNAPAVLWLDDVSAVITSPVSLALLEGPQSWEGHQNLKVRITNRQPTDFRGTVLSSIRAHSEKLAVVLPANSSREVSLPLTVKGTGQHAYRIELTSNAGERLRAMEGKFRTTAPLVLYPPCPCYFRKAEGLAKARVDARINLDPAQRTSSLKLEVRLLDPTGKTVGAASTETFPGGTAGVDLNVPLQAAARYTVKVSLVRAPANVLASAETDLQVAPPQLSRVEVGPDGFLRIGSQREFPIGMYSCGHFEEMGKAGFTGTHNYGITTGEPDAAINPNDAHLKELLDQSWACGMRMMVELPRKAIEKAQWQQVRRRVQTFRYHPGLLCWGSEERVARGEAPLKNIVELYQIVHELDPDHPLVLGDTKDVIQKFKLDRRDFFPEQAMDIGIWWWYPIPIKAGQDAGLDGAISKSSLEPPPWLTTTICKKPLWIAIQAYQKPQKDARFPTPAEYRCQAYLSIINGVKGLWLYTGSGQRDYEGKPAGLLNKPSEGHWDYVQKLVRELKDLSPVFMSPQCDKPKILPADSSVQCGAFATQSAIYWIAVNKSVDPVSVEFTDDGLKGRAGRVLFENQPVSIKGDSLVDQFPGLGVKVYEFTPRK